eukprot:1139326-Pelagomonas_calceolata.AAC.2
MDAMESRHTQCPLHHERSSIMDIMESRHAQCPLHQERQTAPTASPFCYEPKQTFRSDCAIFDLNETVT